MTLRQQVALTRIIIPVPSLDREPYPGATYVMHISWCAGCQAFSSNGTDHVCLVYDGVGCRECGLPTIHYTVGAPGFGTGRRCKAGHDEELTPQGILTLEDVR